jgi:hypothetical protein
MRTIVEQRRDNAAMRPRRLHAALIAFAAWGGAGCSPALDWREFVPEGTDVTVSFPCRPDRVARQVMLAGAAAPMQMLACSAGEATFALAFVDVEDPARVGATLSALRQLAVGNLQGAAPQLSPLQVRGMTPNPQATRLSVSGRLPDGAAVQEHAAFFVRGRRVYQASVIGAQPPPAAVDAFITGLKFPA